MEKINEPKPSQWAAYYAITDKLPPSALLVEALPFLTAKDHALDLGAGALKDSKFLLAEGIKFVTIVDSEPLMEKSAAELPPERIKIVVTTFDAFNFPENEYNLVNAQYSLPFNPPETLNVVINKMKNSLKQDGVFAGQLFGANDEWNVPGKPMAFYTLEEAKSLFSDMEIIKFEEVEKDGKVADGTPKHWNYFNIIARKV